MSVSSATSSIRYAGNGSTVTPYSIPFPFLDTSHIYAAVSSNGTVDPVLLSPSAFTVTRLADGSGGSLRTVAAVTSPAEIVILRQLPLTQPTEFQTAGPFPARSAETGLDRLLMICQQINRRLNSLEEVEGDDYVSIPTGATDSSAVPTWANAAARATTKPARAGQLGVERETQTVWISQSASVGDWDPFAPRRTGRLVLGLIADGSPPGAYQTAAADLLTAWAPDAVLFAGGGNNTLTISGDSSAGNYDADWSAFAPFVTAGTAYPALGPVDVDGLGWQARHAAKFAYLPGNRRYYSKVLGDGLVELFVLHTGFNSIRDLVEPDGNAVGSAQHTWFVAALAASQARWKIAVYSQPPVTLATAENTTAAEMAWPELAGVDLICCGHTHLLEVLKWHDVMIVNTSALSLAEGVADDALQGTGTATAWPLFVDDTSRGLGRLVVKQDSLSVEIWSTAGVILHARAHNDFSLIPS